MSAGVIVQEGAPREVYLQPNSKFVANFIGSTNQLNGQVSKTGDDGTGVVRTDAGEICCGLLSGLTTGSEVVVMVRPEVWCSIRKIRYEAKDIVEVNRGRDVPR